MSSSTSDYLTIADQQLDAGEMFSDKQSNQRVIVLGPDIADALFGANGAVGFKNSVPACELRISASSGRFVFVDEPVEDLSSLDPHVREVDGQCWRQGWAPVSCTVRAVFVVVPEVMPEYVAQMSFAVDE